MLTLLESTVAVPTLTWVWFLLVAVLWLGYFFLEGFDYGVAMLIPVLGKNEKDKRVIVNTIGPVWDGNEVWLLTAGGAMFAAFPGWYASLFSGLYVPLLLVLVGLILRGVAFEYRSKHPDTAYRTMLDWFATIGSFLPSLVFGVGFANFIIGLANDGLHFNGSFFGLFGPFALLGGVMLVVLFLVHGAAFIALKTKGHIHDNAESLGAKGAGLARALVRIRRGGARYLILDEPTAGLDAETEARVIDAVRDTGAGALIVSHRPAVLEAADRVVEVVQA